MRLPKNWPLDVPKSDDARYAEAEALDRAYAEAEAFDARYERVRCVTCGQHWQRIDWGSVGHAYFCPNPVEGPPEPEALDADTPEDWERIAGDRR